MGKPTIRVPDNARVQKKLSVGVRIGAGVCTLFLGTIAVLATNEGDVLIGIITGSGAVGFAGIALSKYRDLS